MTFSRARCVAGVALLLPSLFCDAAAQPGRLSQPGSVSQRIANTVISIQYNRPVARGRALFGELVPYDAEWHPGADEATTIEITDDVLVAGHELPAGTYTLWAVPRERGPWQWIFSNAINVAHRPYPEGQDQLRVDVEVTAGSHMEVMAFYFPEVGSNTATLTFHWGTTIVRIPIVLQ